MNNTELNRLSDNIWSKLNCIENQNKSKEEQVALIKPFLIELASDSRKVGRNQILNYLDAEVKTLRDNNQL